MRTMFAPVTVYTQPLCKPCDRVKEKLTAAGIEFDAVDLSANAEAYTYVRDVLKARSTPVILTDAFDPIIGYQPDKLAELVEYFTASETGL
ncbi:glutaredoxin [Mycobacterium phage EvilGenius]|uniref:Glutaredoxin n=1 Tax=Mycobacterium phage EvilGenius TaxID=1821723 RepID=A0A143FPF8_9CAUD|nr:glutaredoxin [Mycobacterium phage EvilGenius]AMW64137.1 glutaredoxin [Mycobacterium phage EvilGenius]AMW64316.1 NrdH-like redoxin [Mycobacterium phage ChipMunk]QKY78850.1 glutaredoxin [Mycobacterium phage KingCyrus]